MPCPPRVPPRIENVDTLSGERDLRFESRGLDPRSERVEPPRSGALDVVLGPLRVSGRPAGRAGPPRHAAPEVVLGPLRVPGRAAGRARPPRHGGPEVELGPVRAPGRPAERLGPPRQAAPEVVLGPLRVPGRAAGRAVPPRHGGLEVVFGPERAPGRTAAREPSARGAAPGRDPPDRDPPDRGAAGRAPGPVGFLLNGRGLALRFMAVHSSMRRRMQTKQPAEAVARSALRAGLGSRPGLWVPREPAPRVHHQHRDVRGRHAGDASGLPDRAGLPARELLGRLAREPG